MASSAGRRVESSPAARERAQRRRSHIERTAAHLFAQEGYVTVSVQRIAAAAGIDKTNLYDHIASKQALLCSVVMQAQQTAWDSIRQATAGSADAPTELRRLLHAVLTFIAGNREAFQLVTRESRGLDADSEAILLAARQEYHEFIVDIVRRGQKTGAFAAAMDADAIACALRGLLSSAGDWSDKWNRETTERAASTIEVLVLGGLALPSE